MIELPSESEITELCFVVARLKKHRRDETHAYEYERDLTTLLAAVPRLLDIVEFVAKGQFLGLSPDQAEFRRTAKPVWTVHTEQHAAPSAEEIAGLRESCDSADEESHLCGRVCWDTDTGRRLLDTVERTTELERMLLVLLADPPPNATEAERSVGTLVAYAAKAKFCDRALDVSVPVDDLFIALAHITKLEKAEADYEDLIDRLWNIVLPHSWACAKLDVVVQRMSERIADLEMQLGEGRCEG
jgi:hypothetical protein